MGTLLEILKGIFFFLTIVVGLFFLRGDVIISAQYYDIVRQVLMPGYLIFYGTMLGYIISRIWIGYDEEKPNKNQIYTKSFLIGIGIGILLAIIYIFI
ncbi:MAG: hypothetical protein CO170_03840 [candidate division SR1 bacterium CG_4_9_14_3_um_filter_40_9]|nr:MAG: hypothetical protein CO170_03840 [candidate division SR1 bacterium CG_4_9_14_3_um_filter_40_9]